MTSLGEPLAGAATCAAGLVTICNCLHPDNAGADFRSIDDVISANALPMYDRMHDGSRIDHNTSVLLFAAYPAGRAQPPTQLHPEMPFQ